MNQPPGGGYPPGPPYQGQPGFPQQGYPQQQPQQQQAQPAPVGQPGAAKPFMGTALMPGAPAIPGMNQMNPAQAAQAQVAAAQQAAQQQQYGGAPPQQQQYGGAPPQQQYGGAPPQQAYGAAPGGYDPNAQAQGPQGGYPGAAPQGGYPGGQQPYGQPPGGYGAPPQQGGPMQQQQQPGGVGMPQLGIGGFGSHGMPRINIGGGDFSPMKLVGAITTGQGFNSPRKMGAIMIGLSFVLGIVNTILVLVLHLYYPYLYSVAAIFGWAGTWLLVTGQPRARDDGTPAPMWSRIGLAAFFGWGVLVGAALCFFNWEAMLASAAISGATGQ
jgi:hypothetical protein